jgi:hypothetical protein
MVNVIVPFLNILSTLFFQESIDILNNTNRNELKNETSQQRTKCTLNFGDCIIHYLSGYVVIHLRVSQLILSPAK